MTMEEILQITRAWRQLQRASKVLVRRVSAYPCQLLPPFKNCCRILKWKNHQAMIALLPDYLRNRQQSFLLHSPVFLIHLLYSVSIRQYGKWDKYQKILRRIWISSVFDLSPFSQPPTVLQHLWEAPFVAVTPSFPEPSLWFSQPTDGFIAAIRRCYALLGTGRNVWIAGTL